MKINEFEVEIFFIHQIKTHGRFGIRCEVRWEGKTKTFEKVIKDNQFLAKILEMVLEDQTYEEIQKVYRDRFIPDFQDEILDWCKKA